MPIGLLRGYFFGESAAWRLFARCGWHWFGGLLSDIDPGFRRTSICSEIFSFLSGRNRFNLLPGRSCRLWFLCGLLNSCRRYFGPENFGFLLRCFGFFLLRCRGSGRKYFRDHKLSLLKNNDRCNSDYQQNQAGNFKSALQPSFPGI